MQEGLMKVSRSSKLLQLRAHHNSYPIMVDGTHQDRLRCRYMRHWIETGHEKARLPPSPLLSVAMDSLDKALDEEQIFNKKLEAGDMVFTTNMQFVHARDAFVDSPSQSPRHMVRVWIQIQELDEELNNIGTF